MVKFSQTIIEELVVAPIPVSQSNYLEVGVYPVVRTE